jgi:hypothetical protein
MMLEEFYYPESIEKALNFLLQLVCIRKIKIIFIWVQIFLLEWIMSLFRDCTGFMQKTKIMFIFEKIFLP